MNTNERKPVVSSTYLIVTAPRFETAGESAMYARGIKTAEAYFHDLITSGNLRVVEEVEYDRSYCKHCGNCDDYGNQWEEWNYCPKCGNKIKR